MEYFAGKLQDRDCDPQELEQSLAKLPGVWYHAPLVRPSLSVHARRHRAVAGFALKPREN